MKVFSQTFKATVVNCAISAEDVRIAALFWRRRRGGGGGTRAVGKIRHKRHVRRRASRFVEVDARGNLFRRCERKGRRKPATKK